MPVSRRTVEQYRVVGDTPAIDTAARADGVELLPNPGSKLELRLKPYWWSDCGRAVVYVGDCLEIMAQMEPNQFHTVVTDPPYGLEFMGKEWDAPWRSDARVEVCDEGMDPSHPFRDGSHRVCYGNKRVRKVDARSCGASEMDDPIRAKYLRHNVEYVRDSYLYQEWFWARATEMLRVAKPGAHLLSFGGTRMWHRMACAVEDAGWDIRDTLMWVYGGGFPKSHDVSKAIDKMLGVTRQRTLGGSATRAGDGSIIGLGHSGTLIDNEPITDAARQWGGWGTALKPSYEPVILARRPLIESVAQNILEHGTGALNIDRCRVGTEGGCRRVLGTGGVDVGTVSALGGRLNSCRSPQYEGLGRWPANLVHDGSDEVVGLFPQTTSTRQVVTSTPGTVYGAGAGLPSHTGLYGFDDSGSAARLFYTTKADEDDRPHGRGATTHPTVKPLDLMCYLVRLVCVLGGVVLDPFMGSGSTGCAAIEEGMRFVGIEQSQEYADLAVGRLRLALDKCPLGERLETGRPVATHKDAPPRPERLR